MVPARAVRVGRPGLARRRRRATSSPSSTGSPTTATDRDRHYAVLGIRHPLALAAACRSTCARRAPISVRGHSIGGFGSVTTNKLHRHDRRRGVRQARAGVSALRLGEEGPADDVLPDDRRRSRSASTPSSTGSISCRSTTWRRSASGDPLARPRRRRDACSSSRRSPIPAAIWAAIPPAARAEIVARRIRRDRARHRRPRASPDRRDRTSCCGCRASRWSASFLRVSAVRRASAGLDRRGAAGGRRRTARAVLRQARRRGRGREPRADRVPPTTALIDVTAALGLPAGSSAGLAMTLKRRAALIGAAS